VTPIQALLSRWHALTEDDELYEDSPVTGQALDELEIALREMVWHWRDEARLIDLKREGLRGAAADIDPDLAAKLRNRKSEG